MERLENQFINNTPYDQRILKVLKQCGDKSISSVKIALLVGLTQDRIDRILSSCAKHGLVRKVTVRKVSYWKWVGDDE